MGFQQGLSGLNAASRNLDVIGHNIANANTTGFKSSRAEFADMVASSMGVAKGGNNGMGVEVAAVAQQFTQGNITATGNSMDLAINGNGFFKVRLPSGQDAYTRAGNFQLDKNGDVRTNGGAQVMGYKVSYDPTTGAAATSATPAALQFPLGEPIAAKASTSITVTLNLDARARDATGVAAIPADPATNTPAIPAVAPTPASTYGTSIDVYDSLGVPRTVQLYFLRDESLSPAGWQVYNDLAKAETDIAAGTLDPANSIGQLFFNADGSLDTATSTINSITTNPYTLPDIPPDPDNNQSAGDLIGVTLDLAKVTQFGNAFAVSDLRQDGYTSGNLTSINTSDDGSVMVSYSNGVTRKEAQVALASFRNPQGLTPIGGNNWVETADSGHPILGTPGSGTFGTLRSGALEDSNVDLTAELVGMMTAQRSYQANAQTIKTQDQVLSTIVNLR